MTVIGVVKRGRLSSRRLSLGIFGGSPELPSTIGRRSALAYDPPKSAPTLSAGNPGKIRRRAPPDRSPTQIGRRIVRGAPKIPPTRPARSPARFASPPHSARQSPPGIGSPENLPDAVRAMLDRRSSPDPPRATPPRATSLARRIPRFYIASHRLNLGDLDRMQDLGISNLVFRH